MRFLKEGRMRTARGASNELTTGAPAEASESDAEYVSTNEARQELALRSPPIAPLGARPQLADGSASGTSKGDGFGRDVSDEVFRQIGSRYLAEMVRAVEVVVENRFRSELAFKDEMISGLEKRLATADRKQVDLQDRIDALEKELEGRTVELHYAFAQHREDLNGFSSALARLGMAVERSKGRIGMLADDSSPFPPIVEGGSAKVP